MKRRSFLTAGLSTALFTGLSGEYATIARAQPSLERLQQDFDQFVNIVDAGADPNGNEPITPILEQNARSDDTLVYFPPGEYRMNRRFRFTGFNNYGIVGDEAVIVPDDYHNFDNLGRNAHMLFLLGTAADPGNGLLFQDLTIDQTREDTGARVIQTEVENDLRVRNINVRGFHDTGSHGPGLFHITDPTGQGVVEGFRAPGGGAYSSNAPGDIGDFHLGPTGIMMGTNHLGTILYRDCVLGGFPDNGLYDSVGPGRCIVEGGVYRNSNVANIRLGGDDSIVRDVRVMVDENRPEDTNQRGIRMDHGDNLAIRDCEIRLQRPTGHAITASGKSSAGNQTLSIENTSITIEGRNADGIVLYNGSGATEIWDTDFQMSGSRQAISIMNGLQSTSGRVICDNINITGGANGSQGREAIYCARDGSEFRNVEIHQTGGQFRQGLGIRANNVKVLNCDFRTTYWSITNVGSNTRIVDSQAEATAGVPAVRLYEGHENVSLINNDFENGIRDDGGQGLVVYSS